MRKFIIFLALALILVVGGGALFALTQANSIIAKLKPELEKAGGEALQTKLELGAMKLSFFPRLSFQIDGLSLTDLRDSAKQLSVGSGAIQIGLFDLLLGRVKIDAILLSEPDITLEQSKKGMRVYGIGGKEKQSRKKATSQDSKAPESRQESAPSDAPPLPSWLTLSLDSIKLERGKLTMIPLQGEALVVENMDFSTSFSFESDEAAFKNLNFSALVKDKGDFSLFVSEGKAHVQKFAGSISSLRVTATLPKENSALSSELTDIVFDNILQKVLIQKIQGTARHPKAEDANFLLQKVGLEANRALIAEGNLTATVENIGKTEVSLKEISYLLPSGVAEFGGVTLSLLQGTITAKGRYTVPTHTGEINVALKDVTYQGEPFSGDFSIVANQQAFFLKESPLQAFGTSIGLSGGAKPFEATLPFHGKTSLKGLSLERVMTFLQPGNPALVTGTLQSMTGSAEGAAKPDLQKSIVASTQFEVIDGTFKGGNLPALVLKAMKDIPFLNKAIFESVPPEHQKELDGDTTPIKNLKVTAHVRDAVMNCQSLQLVSSLFSLDAQGTIGLDGKLDLKTTFRFIPAFSLALTKKVSELRGLLDKDQRLIVPLQIAGTTRAPIILPNMQEVMKLGAGQVIKDKAGDLLGKALGGKSDSETGKVLKGLGSALGF